MKDTEDIPLSHSQVTLRLADIQKRCSELIKSDDEVELSLLEPIDSGDGCNPYNYG